MKNKKSIAMAMAAVSTFGAVAPAFANEVSTLALQARESVDVRLASGYNLVEKGRVFTRSEIFNYNGDATDRDKHTLKSTYADKTILVEKLAEKPENDVFVLGTKNTNTSEVKAAAAKLEALKEEINEYVSKGYELTKKEIKATIENNVYTTGNTVVTLTKGTDVKKVIFDKVDEISTTTEEKTDAEKTNALRKEVFGEGVATKQSFELNVVAEDAKDATELEKAEYNKVNRLKYTIESNITKFDIVKDEDGNKNQDLKVTLYRKGSAKKDENKVMTITFKNVKDVEEDLIVTIPQTNDFTGHWAQNQIADAMLAGHVDASANYRPQDSITRAEFAKIACTVFGIKYNKGDIEPFNDVNKNEWYYEYVTALYNKQVDGVSVVQGDGENFRPNDKITRQEVAVIVAKLTSNKAVETVRKDINGNNVNKVVKTKFKDTKEIADWADESVDYLSKKEYTTDKFIVQGDNGYFNPTQAITRAESLVMVQRAASATTK